jgi:glycosyltransferase involved in cell wall biosynthesis
MMNSTVLFITAFWPKIGHHASFSGYHQLVKYLNIPSKLLIRPNKMDLITLAMNKMPHFMSKLIKCDFYSLVSLSFELKSILQSCELIHHLYGEDTCLVSPLIKKVSNKKVIATFHQPPKLFERYMPLHWRKIMGRLDHIIVLSTTQQDFLVKNLRDESKISFIPHGVEFNYFKPSSYELRNCLMVGQWLRDFDTALKAMKIVQRKGVKLIFDVVLPSATPKNVVQKMKNASPPNTYIHYNISEEALLKLYSNSRMFLMPLLDFTASNSLLEAMASGLPIIITDVGGVRDYVDEKCGILVKKFNPNAMAEAITYLSEDEIICKRMGRNSRTKASSLSWNVIAPLYEDILVRVSH